MIFNIKNQFIDVMNDCKEFSEYIYGRFKHFDNDNINKNQEVKHLNNYLKFNKDNVEILVNQKKLLLKNEVLKTDIYPIINNVIAFLINDENNIYVHSVTVSKNNNGVLILGDFGQGKSTLSKAFENNGYEINSTDQTWIEFNNGKLYQKLGSSFDIENGKIKYLDIKNCKKNIEIKKIIRIAGICDNGDICIKENQNKAHFIKNIATYCNWSYVMPIFTDDVELYNTNLYVKEFWKKINMNNTQCYDVRGDKNEIVKKVDGYND